MTISDLKNYTRTMEISLAEELGESVSITIKEPDSFQFLALQKASKEGEEQAFRWVADNLGSLIVSHTFESVNDVKELASALTKRLDVLIKIFEGVISFFDQSSLKQKKTKK